jgi:hypothetical protein
MDNSLYFWKFLVASDTFPLSLMSCYSPPCVKAKFKMLTLPTCSRCRKMEVNVICVRVDTPSFLLRLEKSEIQKLEITERVV